MNMMSKIDETDAKTCSGPTGKNRVVIVFQGGGALGSYQAGVYHALHDAGIRPDWLIGTSIGAINASLIAGNEPENRIAALEEFWRRMSRTHLAGAWSLWPRLTQYMAYGTTIALGLPNFFVPNPLAFTGPHIPLGADNAGYYSTEPLAMTLGDLVDFSLVARNAPRLTVGAAQVCTSQMRYFDSRETELDVKHILASGALPPAFPAVRIDGELYWDGGILSNTPAEVVFEDYPRRDSLVFAVHMWNPTGPEPQTMWEVLHRQKDIQYSSRVASHIRRQADIHHLRRVVRELSMHVPKDVLERADVQALTEHGCSTRIHVMRLLSPGHDTDDHTKDVDFSLSGIARRWEAGYEQTVKAIARQPWNGRDAVADGVVLHELDEMSELVSEPS